MVEAPGGTEKFIQTKTGNIRIPTFNLLQTPSFKSIKEMYNKYLIVDNIPCIMSFSYIFKMIFNISQSSEILRKTKTILTRLTSG